MPFITQCPYCQKFMLLEDDKRGGAAECFLCHSPIQTAQAKAKAVASSSTPPVSDPRKCPSCHAAVQIPANLLGQQVQCPKCRQVFTG